MMQEDTLGSCVKCSKGLTKVSGNPVVAVEMWPNRKEIRSNTVQYYHCVFCMVDYFPKEALLIMTKKLEEIGGIPPSR